VQSAVDNVQKTADAILTQVGELKSQLTQDVIDIELQAALGKLSDNSTIISENFTTYANAVIGITDKDPNASKLAAKQIFALFSTLNLQNISIAATSLQALFDPALAAEKSIPQLFAARIQAALDASVADRGPADGKLSGNYQPDMQENDAGLYLGDGLEHMMRKIADTEPKVAAPVFRSFRALQMQALTLLTTAWIRTDQAPQVKKLIDGLRQSVNRLTEFCDGLLSGDSGWPGIEGQIKEMVTAKASRIGTPYSQMRWTVEIAKSLNDSEPARPAGFPLSDDWLLAWLHFSGSLVVVFRPWGPDGTFMGQPISAGQGALVFHQRNYPDQPVSFQMIYGDPVTAWHPARYALPDEFGFVRDLASNFPPDLP
jgi:hypothetical protein